MTFNQQSQASRYAFIMSARVEFKDLKSGKVLWSNPAVQFREEYEPATAGAVADVTFFGRTSTPTTGSRRSSPVRS